jgi:hypothetical protein
MKIQIDTTLKQIKVEEAVNLGELIETLEGLLPGIWKEFKLETHTTIAWTNPIVIRPCQPYPYWERPWITWGASSSSPIFQLNPGTYNVELQTESNT